MTKRNAQPRPQQGIDGRLAKLESHVESLADTVDRLAGVVSGISDRVGRPNYSALGVAVSVGVALCSLAAFAVFGPIKNNEKAIDRLEMMLTHRIQREEDRNNRLERELGEASAIDRLFIADKLKLGETK